MFIEKMDNGIEYGKTYHEEVLRNRQLMITEGKYFEKEYQAYIKEGVSHNEAVDAALNDVIFKYKPSGCVTNSYTYNYYRGRLVYIGAYRAKVYIRKPLLKIQNVVRVLEENEVPNICTFVECMPKTTKDNAFKAVIKYTTLTGYNALAEELKTEYDKTNKQGNFI